MNPKISVIIPLYNKANCVEQTLMSVFKQTFTNFEVIVVNDGSTDNGPEIVKRCTDPRLNLITQDNKGPGAARNVGLANSKGEYIVFLDADDEWLPDFLQWGLDFLNTHEDVATISFGYYNTQVNDIEVTKRLDKRGIKDGIYELTDNTPPELACWLIGYMSSCTTMVRKAIVEKYGGFFDDYKCLYGEDDYLWFKVILNEKIGIIREKLVIIHSENSNLCTSNLLHPVPPVLLDPKSIEINCPLEKRCLLGEILSVYAIEESKHYSAFGEKAKAAKLLDNFCSIYKPKMYYTAKIYMYMSTLIPHLRNNPQFMFCWKKMRTIFHQQFSLEL